MRVHLLARGVVLRSAAGRVEVLLAQEVGRRSAFLRFFRSPPAALAENGLRLPALVAMVDRYLEERRCVGRVSTLPRCDERSAATG